MHLSRIFLASTILVAGCFAGATHPLAEVVGKTVSVKTDVVGDKGRLKRADPVSRNEQITTNASGLGHFQFGDGAKLAVGPSSSIVIDEYVLGSGSQVKKLSLNATQGAFRWISGKSPSSAYEISTPVGTLGVRGTAVDIYLRNGVAAMVLLNGSARWCNDGRCVEVDRPCQLIIAQGGSNISDPRQVSASGLDQLGGASALYFFTNYERLHPAFRTAQADCGMGARLRTKRNADTPSRPEHSPRSGGRGRGNDGGGNQEGGLF
jgi:hypothetical protein